MSPTYFPGVRATTLALLSTFLVLGVPPLPAAAGFPFRFPQEIPPVDPATIKHVSECRQLRIANDRPALLARNAELVAGDLDDAWLIYCLAHNAGTVLSRSQALVAIANRDLAALAGGPVADADLRPDAWLLMNAIIDWLGSRYASAESVLEDLNGRNPDWAPTIGYLRWRCSFSRLAPIVEQQAYLDHLATDGAALWLLLSSLSNIVKE